MGTGYTFLPKLNLEFWHKQGSTPLRLQVIVAAIRALFLNKLLKAVFVWRGLCMCPQTPEVEQLGRVVELDSDMADITQELPQESVLEDNMMEEQEAVPASTHIASTLGINPHVLQVGVLYFPPKGEGFVVSLSNFLVCPPRLVTNS